MQLIARRSLQQSWIQPLERKLKELGCRVHLKHRLESVKIDAGRVKRLRFDVSGKRGHALTLSESYDHQADVTDLDVLILAIPLERVIELLDALPSLVRAARLLGNLRYLRTKQMTEMNLYLVDKADLPRGHVNTDSRFGFSFIDVSQVWSGLPRTVLETIASDTTPLEKLPPWMAEEWLLDDLRPYLDCLAPPRIAKVDFHSHEDKPLFMSDVGAWQFRPTAFTELSNLYLAGDYCRTHVDLVSMEGAIVSGLLAARAVLRDRRLPEDVEILVPKTPSIFLLVLVKLLLLPLAALAKLALMLFYRPEAKPADQYIANRWSSAGRGASPERHRDHPRESAGSRGRLD
jgi:hypothetical protein